MHRHIPYPVYRFEAGDVDNDGHPDILLGVTKATHFDPQVKRRIFVYRVTRTGLSPMWLGSRVCQALVDFHCVRRGAEYFVLTIERSHKGGYCNGLYKWHDFGLELVKYTHEETDYDTAHSYFCRQSTSR